MSSTRPLDVTVTAVDSLNPLIRQLTLQSTDGGPLPGFDAGAHVRVQVTLSDGITDWRHYSLITFDLDPAAQRAPDHYTIAVRREDEGRGGSRFMHGLRIGDRLTIDSPKNDFPLGIEDGRAVLVAGGIGVTPLTSMAAELTRSHRGVRMVYAGRSRDTMAFLPELQALLGNDLEVHADQEVGASLNVDALLAGCDPDDWVYICGPQALLDAVLAAAHARRWVPERVRFELFTPPVPQTGDHAFEVVLARSGMTHTVPADQTILECLIEHGCDPLYDCKRGECGVCAVPVIEGAIDHRDYVLTDAEKSGGKVMQICVSRARGPRLVLDL